MSTKEFVKQNKRKLESKNEMPPAKKGHWSAGLMESMKDPNLVVYDDERIVIIKDKFPKAQYHYLVLPQVKLPNFKSVNYSHLPLFEEMDRQAHKLCIAKHPKVEFRYGYHAIPSMAQVHLHAISQDFISPCLKTKKHWNSFNTDYFIDSSAMLSSLRETGAPRPCSLTESTRLLSLELRCHRCQLPLSNMPALKRHLLTHAQSSGEK